MMVKLPLLMYPLVKIFVQKGKPSMNFGKGHHLHLIDGSAFIFRAYHALPPLTRNSDGLPVGAVSGFCNMLQRYVESNTGPDAPTHVAVIFDKGSHTFRNDLYDQYKANRDANALPLKNFGIIFHILANFQDRRIFQDGLQQPNHLIKLHLARC